VAQQKTSFVLQHAEFDIENMRIYERNKDGDLIAEYDLKDLLERFDGVADMTISVRYGKEV